MDCDTQALIDSEDALLELEIYFTWHNVNKPPLVINRVIDALVREGRYGELADLLWRPAEKQINRLRAQEPVKTGQWYWDLRGLHLGIFVIWLYLQEPDPENVAQNMAHVKETLVSTTKEILAEACRYAVRDTRGLLWELIGDVLYLCSEIASSERAYMEAGTQYGRTGRLPGEEPEYNPFFLQYDLIWKDKILPRYAPEKGDLDRLFNHDISRHLDFVEVPSYRLSIKRDVIATTMDL